MDRIFLWFLTMVPLLGSGACKEIVRGLIRQAWLGSKENKARFSAEAYPGAREVAANEMSDTGVNRGYDSPEVSRYDALVRVNLFLKTAKRPVDVG
ncbi:MAG TPA: hypothetical protein VNL14_08220 [Candidatus Acidoferrales bacterium]|nr:hypothetical protein [Candidatus Acidoferrales bacterium]